MNNQESTSGKIYLLLDVLRIKEKRLAEILSVSGGEIVCWKEGRRTPIFSVAARIDELCSLVEHAEEVFAEGKIGDWFETKNVALGGVTPLEVLAKTDGIEQVNNIIGRIEYGIPS